MIKKKKTLNDQEFSQKHDFKQKIFNWLNRILAVQK